MCTPLPHLGTGWTDCTEVWCVVIEKLPWCFTQVKLGYIVLGWDAYIRTCARVYLYVRDSFRISEAAGRIVLSIGVVMNQLAMYFVHLLRLFFVGLKPVRPAQTIAWLCDLG